MSTDLEILKGVSTEEYKYGFTTEIEMDFAPKGLSEDTVRFISAKKNEPEWLLEWRLKALKHFQQMTMPKWQNFELPAIDFQAISYYAAPRKKAKLNSLEEVDPELLAVGVDVVDDLLQTLRVKRGAGLRSAVGVGPVVPSGICTTKNPCPSRATSVLAPVNFSSPGLKLVAGLACGKA